jgi:hypothetical protein
MKKLLVVLVTMSGMAFADGIAFNPANTVVPMPAPATYLSGTGNNTPFFNNNSAEGLHLNAGFFLTDTGGFSSGTLAPIAAGYLGQVANNNNAPLSFAMVRQANSINVTVLYQNAQTNLGPGGTAFGIYDVGTNAQTQIYGSGTIPANVGVTTAPISTAGISGAGLYGFYATVCQFPSNATNCYTFYSDTGKNPAVFNGSGLEVEGPGSSTGAHQHFALFTLAGNATTFYLAFDNSWESTDFDGVGGAEKQGDYNSVIFQITTAVPEPATLSLMGFGLLGLGLMGRRLRK